MGTEADFDREPAPVCLDNIDPKTAISEPLSRAVDRLDPIDPLDIIPDADKPQWLKDATAPDRHSPTNGSETNPVMTLRDAPIQSGAAPDSLKWNEPIPKELEDEIRAEADSLVPPKCPKCGCPEIQPTCLNCAKVFASDRRGTNE